MGGSGISWNICKSFAPHSRQTTMPVPHHSVFKGRMPFLPLNQQCQSTEGRAFYKHTKLYLNQKNFLWTDGSTDGRTDTSEFQSGDDLKWYGKYHCTTFRSGMVVAVLYVLVELPVHITTMCRFQRGLAQVCALSSAVLVSLFCKCTLTDMLCLQCDQDTSLG